METPYADALHPEVCGVTFSKSSAAHAYERRPVWYLGPDEAQSYDTEEQGRTIHHRAPDAFGLYSRDEDGHLQHVKDCDPAA